MTLSTLSKAGLVSLAALSSFAVIPSAQAAITFNFDDVNLFGSSTIEVTSGGFKMVLSNYNSPSGNFSGNDTGIALIDPSVIGDPATDSTKLPFGSQFSIEVFTAAMAPVDFVTITGYMVGVANESGTTPGGAPIATLDLSIGGSPVSEDNPFNAVNTFVFNNAPIALAAGQEAVLSASYTENKAGNTLKSLIIEVPEPMTMMGASAAVAFGAAFKKRRAAQK